MTSRLPPLRPQDLDEQQRALYAQITGGRRAQGPELFPLTDQQGALHGPFNALIHAPSVGSAMSRLGEVIRYESSLTAQIREIAILAVAAHHRSDFEWYAHERVGRHIGLTDTEIERLRHLEPLKECTTEEIAAYDLVRAVLRHRDVPDDTYQQAVQQLGRTVTVELVMLVGYYQALALLLSAFRLPAPQDVAWPALEGDRDPPLTTEHGREGPSSS